LVNYRLFVGVVKGEIQPGEATAVNFAAAAVRAGRLNFPLGGGGRCLHAFDDGVALFASDGFGIVCCNAFDLGAMRRLFIPRIAGYRSISV
jgi:hypothetical protein